MKTILLLLFLCVNCFNVFSNNFSDAYKKAQTFYKNARYLHMEANIKLFKNSNDTKGMDFGNGTMFKTKSKYYSRYGAFETIADGKNLIMIDHELKKIQLTESPLPKMENQILPDSIFDNNKSITYLGTKGGVALFQILIPKGLIEKYIIGFDSKSNYIKSYEYHIRSTKEKIVEAEFKIGKVIYSKVSSSKFDEQIFQSKKYFGVEKGKIVLTEKFKGYSLEVNKKAKFQTNL